MIVITSELPQCIKPYWPEEGMERAHEGDRDAVWVVTETYGRKFHYCDECKQNMEEQNFFNSMGLPFVRLI